MPRHPPDAFTYTETEQAQITLALTETKPWDAECVETIKTRIYRYHETLQQKLCCYCLRNLSGEFKLVIDTEHVLPQAKFRPNTFDIWNLSIACKRCNMNVKGQKIDFLVDPLFVAVGKQDSQAYLFVHPNLDEIRDHLSRISLEVDGQRIVSYVVKGGSSKGQYSLDYFRLRQLEVDSFDAAQVSGAESEASEALDSVRAVVQELSRSIDICQSNR